MSNLHDWERCEATTASGRRCPNQDTDSVKNPGAYLPYRVCGTHKAQGERSVAATGEVPTIWTEHWKGWAA